MTLFNTLGYALGCTAIILASLKKHLCPSPSIPRDFHLIGQGWAWPWLFFLDFNMLPRVYKSRF